MNVDGEQSKMIKVHWYIIGTELEQLGCWWNLFWIEVDLVFLPPLFREVQEMNPKAQLSDPLQDWSPVQHIHLLASFLSALSFSFPFLFLLFDIIHYSRESSTDNDL